MQLEDIFARTEGALRNDGSRAAVAVAVLGAALLAAWGYWAFSAEVQRYEVSSAARIEVEQSNYPLQTAVAGRVIESHLELGRTVREGEVLLVLENDREQLQLTEQRVKQQAMSPEIGALREQIRSEEQAGEEDRRATQVARQEALAALRQAEVERQSAQDAYLQQEKLQAAGLLADSEFRKFSTDLVSKQAREQRLRAAVDSVDAQFRVRSNERAARLGELRVDLQRLQGNVRTATATIRTLEYETDNRQLRAPVDGALGEMRELRVGTFIDEGEILGYVVREGDFRVVAEFDPAAAVGRIRPEQRARLRLDGFSWVQYGSVEAEVTRVAQEIRDDFIRVECRILGDPPAGLEFQHGLPGTLEVYVEEISPATLALRAAGRLVAEPRSWFQAQTNQQ